MQPQQPYDPNQAAPSPQAGTPQDRPIDNNLPPLPAVGSQAVIAQPVMANVRSYRKKAILLAALGLIGLLGGLFVSRPVTLMGLFASIYGMTRSQSISYQIGLYLNLIIGFGCVVVFTLT